MPATDTYLGLRAFVDELARCGLREACTSPGSRSTPLVLSLAREPRIRTTSHIDERCGSFFALGLAKTTGLPVALACTSGTAAANYAPAVIEAHEARVPLLVLTADRPPELRELGAGQTIDQVKLYGRAAKWYLEVDDHPATPERMRWLRQLACRAFWTAVDGRPGPVHLNFSLREPLVLDAPLPDEEPGGGGRAGERPWVTRPRTRLAPADTLLDGLRAAVDGSARGVIVAGRSERDPGLGEALASVADALALPLLADPLSGARRGPAAVAHYDALLRDPEWAAAHAPDLVLRIGDLPTSKPLRAWLHGLDGALQIAFDAENAWQDPAGAVATIVGADPRVLAPETLREERGWLEEWRAADRAAAAAIADVLGAEGLSEPRVAAELGVRLPPDATLVVASSMPVRDVETFFPARDAPPRVLANRGANGIDGTVSTAFGVAAAGRRTVLLIGDVALAHDIGGLLAAGRLGLDLTIVLLNNDGGGIFHFLPVARQGGAFEEHVATPHGLDFAHAARLYGLRHELVRTPESFRAALDEAEGATIIEVRTDRAANVELHGRVWHAILQSVRGGA
jgi:2-succinyl-5-enolpyruvyl-6-hydroxy-3-cyclohexene-1-carboxylate synthase